MNHRGNYFAAWIVGTMSLASFVAVACHSGPSTAKAQEEAPAAAEQSSPGHMAIDLNCIAAEFNNPAEAFHFSYSRTGQPDSLKVEADVTPSTPDGTLKSVHGGESARSNTVHAMRSDHDGWRMAAGYLSTSFGMPASLMEGGWMVTATKREGAEQVNGYDTIRYSLDSARLDIADRALLGRSEKGTIWATSNGCPVRWNIDSVQTNADKSTDDAHIEGNVTRK
jgi:hypothetical protein